MHIQTAYKRSNSFRTVISIAELVELKNLNFTCGVNYTLAKTVY